MARKSFLDRFSQPTRDLFVAARDGDLEAVQSALARGGEADPRDNTGSTALMMACLHGHPEIAELLLAAGALTTARNDMGAEPLAMAAGEWDSLGCVHALLKAGADPHARDHEGRCALAVAASNDNAAAAAALLAAGADIDARDNNGSAALGWAESMGHERTQAVLAIAMLALAEAKELDGSILAGAPSAVAPGKPRI